MDFDLKKFREQSGYSQIQLARKMGCTQGRISQIESGGKISIELAKKLALILQCEWWDIYDEINKERRE